MIKKYIFTAFTLTMAMAVQAQLFQHNLDVTVGGGLQSLQYSPQDGDHKPLFGGALNANYRYSIDENWGVGAGVGLGFYNAKAQYDAMLLKNDLVHPHNGEAYEHRSYFKDWEEKQRLLELEIPLSVHYSLPMKDRWSFIGGLGAKLNIPVWNKYVNTDGNIQTTGFFEELTNIEYENLPQHYFENLNGFEGKSKMKKLGVSPFLEVGFLRDLMNNKQLYLGAYFSYGVTNMNKEKESPIFDSKNYIGSITSNQVDKVHLLACGVKVGISFGFPKIYPLPVMQHELDMDEEDMESRYNEIVEAEKKEAEEVMRAAEELRKQEEARKAEEDAKAKKIISWLNKNIKVNFDLNKAVIESNDEIESYIKDLVAYIKDNPEKIVTIYGHTCNLGREDKNIILGQRRADAMREKLIIAGCPAQNIVAKSKGSSEPLVPNTNETNRKKNRRIELKID